MRAAFLPLVLFGLALSLVAVFSACAVSPAPESPSRPNKVIMGYYPGWEKSVYDHTKIPFENLTHIAHAFAWPDADGNLVVPADLLYPGLNTAARAAGVKMILSLGGWGNCAGFPGMSRDRRQPDPVHRPARRFLQGQRLRRGRHRLGVRRRTTSRRPISPCSSKPSRRPSRPSRRPSS